MPHLDRLRIVSLLPSATEILAELDLTPYIVGRSHECDYPAEIVDRPVCTRARLDSDRSSRQIDSDVQSLLRSSLSIYDLDLDLLKQLQPTHIVTQDQCDVCAVSFATVEAAVATLAQPQPQVISLQPNLLSEVWADLDRVADRLGVDAQPALGRLQHRVDRIGQQTQHLSAAQRPTVAAIEWIEPLMASGNWIPELVELAGGRDRFGKLGAHSPYLNWDDLLAADPDVVIVMPCGFDLTRTRQEMQTAIASCPQWQHLQAVQRDRLYITDGNAYFNRPGPRLVDSLEILLELLHPDLAATAYQGTGWERFEQLSAVETL